MNRLFILFFSLLSSVVFAQPGTNDPSFNIADNGHYGNNNGLVGAANVIKIQPDGKILVGGSNNLYNGVAQYKLTRINPDGSIDNSFDIGSGFNSEVYSISVQPDGKILVGGMFSVCDGVSRNRIARLNPDGSLDLTFDPGSGFDSGLVYSIDIQDDSKIIVGGAFSSFNGTSRKNIARLNPNGSLDLTFNSGTGFIGNNGGYVRSLFIQSDGKIVTAGEFISYNGTNRSNIARLNSNGSLDVTFNPGSGFNSTVWAISDQVDGKVVAVGQFTLFNGTSRRRVARLNVNGSLDVSFNPGNGFDTDIAMSASIQEDGKIIVGGGFLAYNGFPQGGIARLNEDGSLDLGFSTGSNIEDARVTNIQTDGKILISCMFTSSYGIIQNGTIKRLNINGSLDSTFNEGTGLDNYVTTMSIQQDGKIVLGGGFTKYYDNAQNRITRLNSDGSLDLTFNSGSGFNNYHDVSVICLQSDGKILVGGNFTAFNGISRNRIARLNSDGSLDLTFNPGSGFNSEVMAINVQSDGKILVGGNFTSFNGFTRYYIIRLNSDGSVDPTFSANANYDVKYITIQSDGKIIASGSFTFFNGNTMNKIVRLNNDGSLDASFTLANGTNNDVNSTIVQTDGKILVGGNFTVFGGQARNRMVRLNTNGSLDPTFNIGTGFNDNVTAISFQNDGKILVVGNFSTFNGISRNRMVRLNTNGSLDPTFNIGAGFNDDVWAISIQGDGKILAGGSFHDFNGTPRNRLARLLNCFPTSSFIIASACNTYSLNGQIYTSSGVYTQTLTNSFGCDSTITLDLTIGSSNDSLFVSACHPYTLNGQTYTTSGVYTQQFINSLGCDSIITLTLIINLPTSNTVTATVCDSFNANGNIYTTSGQYIDTIPNTNGCDSVITFNLTILYSTSNTFTTYACNDYLLNGQIYSSSGVYTQVLSNSTGCDSIVTLNLTILSDSVIDTQTACNSYTWIDGNTYYSSTNTPTLMLQNAAGCDSIITLDLTILNSSTSTETQTVCDSFTWPINGQTYTISGQYTDTVPNALGCDSIITLDLTITNASTGTDIQTSCDSYTWIDGNTYTSSTNTPTFVLQNAAGCDSIVTLNLAILNPSNATQTQTACGSYDWPINGQIYTTSGQYIDTIPNLAGCDSIITLDLTIIPDLPLTIANSFSMPTDANNCVGEAAIDLSGNAPFELDFDSGSQVITSNGYSLVTDLCAGIHDLHVTDNCGDTLSTTIVIPVDSNYVFNNPFIDSLAQDSLGVTMTNCDIYYAGIDTAYIDSIWATGNTVNVIWNIVDSNGSNFDTTTYALNNGNGVYWLQLSVFCPFKSVGEYFTVSEAIYFNNGTVSTAGLTDLESHLFEIYPNPTNDQVHISFSGSEAELTIYDVQGKVVLKNQIQNQDIISLQNFERGVYLFDLKSSNGHKVKRVVKQ